MPDDTFSTFSVGEAFIRKFLVKDFSLSTEGFSNPQAGWDFSFYTESGILRKSVTADSVKQLKDDVEITFVVKRTFFEQSHVGSLKYQVVLFDLDLHPDLDFRPRLVTTPYVGKVIPTLQTR